MDDADRDFLSNEKLKAAGKLYYAKGYDRAIERNLNFADAYHNRGRIHAILKNFDATLFDVKIFVAPAAR